MRRVDKKTLINEIINYERLNRIVKGIEKIVIDTEQLDFVEQKLLYDILLDRRMDKIHQLKMSDSVSKMPLMDLVKSALKKGKDNDVGI